MRRSGLRWKMRPALVLLNPRVHEIATNLRRCNRKWRAAASAWFGKPPNKVKHSNSQDQHAAKQARIRKVFSGDSPQFEGPAAPGSDGTQWAQSPCSVTGTLGSPEGRGGGHRECRLPRGLVFPGKAPRAE